MPVLDALHEPVNLRSGPWVSPEAMNDSICAQLAAQECGAAGSSARLQSIFKTFAQKQMKADRFRRLKMPLQAPLGSALALDHVESRWLLSAFSDGRSGRLVLFDVQPDAGWTIERHSTRSNVYPRSDTPVQCTALSSEQNVERLPIMETTVAGEQLRQRHAVASVQVREPSFSDGGGRVAQAAYRHLWTGLAWYPLDNGLFVSADAQGLVYVFDAATFRSVSRFAFGPPVRSIDWNRGLRQVPAQASQTGSALPGSNFRGSAASPYLLAVASAEPEHQLRLLDLVSGATTHSLLGHSAAITSVRWFPFHEYWLVSGSLDSSIRLWDIRKGGRAACFAILDADKQVPVTSTEVGGRRQYAASNEAASESAYLLPRHDARGHFLRQSRPVDADHCLGYRCWSDSCFAGIPEGIPAAPEHDAVIYDEAQFLSLPQTPRQRDPSGKRAHHWHKQTSRTRVSRRPLAWAKRAQLTGPESSHPAEDWIYLEPAAPAPQQSDQLPTLRSCRAHPASERGILSVRFSADGRYLVSRCERMLLVWDALTGHRYRRAALELSEHFGVEARAGELHAPWRSARSNRRRPGETLGRRMAIYCWDLPDLPFYLGDQRIATGAGTDASGCCWLARDATVYAVRCSPALATSDGRQPLVRFAGPIRSSVYALETHPSRIEVYTTGAGGLVQVWSGLTLPARCVSRSLAECPLSLSQDLPSAAASERLQPDVDTWLTEMEFPAD